jgi:hypothetical protein
MKYLLGIELEHCTPKPKYAALTISGVQTFHSYNGNLSNSPRKLAVLQGLAPMLYFELLRTRNILIVTADGPLERTDFEHFAKEIDPVIAAKGTLTGLLIYVNRFPGWRDFKAFTAHIKFIAGHHRRIDRIAAVTSSDFLKTMTRIFGCLVKPDIKSFDLEQETEALAWLETGSEGNAG